VDLKVRFFYAQNSSKNIRKKSKIMKKILIYAVSIVCTFTATAQTQDLINDNNCNRRTPGWGASLGTVSFLSTRTALVGYQEWSDEVTATHCKKNTFSVFDNTTKSYNADCRKSGDIGGDYKKGDEFSWCAVVRFKNQLCPGSWRVPTKDDFFKLDRVSGGTGYNRSNDYWALKTWYRANWNARISDGNQEAYYWSLSERDATQGFALGLIGYFYGSNSVYPQGVADKKSGFTLRCVRDVSEARAKQIWEGKNRQAMKEEEEYEKKYGSMLNSDVNDEVNDDSFSSFFNVGKKDTAGGEKYVVTIDDYTFEMKVPKQVKVGQQFDIKFVITSTRQINASNFRAPLLFGLDIHSGPTQSQSSSTSIINGQRLQTQNLTLSYRVSAKKEGVININPATIDIDGKTYSIASGVSIQVYK
jgi:uncharacterized protein (TIGR02145 family)